MAPVHAQHRQDGLSPRSGLKLYGSPNDVILVEALGGGAIGAMLPRSNVTLLNKQRFDEFHLAGYGVSSQVGLKLTVFKNFFFHNELKGGFINQPSVRSTPNQSDKSKHSFWFIERFWSLGANLSF